MPVNDQLARSEPTGGNGGGQDAYAEARCHASRGTRFVDMRRGQESERVVQDKLFLPGLMKLKRLIDGGFFGKILSVRGEFGYWVFAGTGGPRSARRTNGDDGGGIIVDMLCHWRYVLDNLFGRVKAVSHLGACHIPRDSIGGQVAPRYRR